MVEAPAQNKHDWVLLYRFSAPEAPATDGGLFGGAAKKAREALRGHASVYPFLQDPGPFRRFGLRVRVATSAGALPDVARIVADALSKDGVRKDRSRFPRLGLWEDATPRHLPYVEAVEDAKVAGVDVEVYGLRA